jgi:hypothetical protein
VRAGRTHDDLQKYDGDGLGGVVGLILGLLVQAAVLFTIPNEIEKMYQREGHQSPVTTLWGPVAPAADHRAVRPVPEGPERPERLLDQQGRSTGLRQSATRPPNRQGWLVRTCQ